MELPTYTSIWRIEKRLYKLYDFRLPMPVPVGQIAVFAAITVPYVIILTVLGLPFSHTLFWLYVLPPGVLTWLATRPVLESKRLPELIISQVRYLGEPATWCRMTPLAEKDEIVVVGRVWRRAERQPEAAPVPAPARRSVPARTRPAPVAVPASAAAAQATARAAAPAPSPVARAKAPSRPAGPSRVPVPGRQIPVTPAAGLARPAAFGQPDGGVPAAPPGRGAAVPAVPSAAPAQPVSRARPAPVAEPAPPAQPTAGGQASSPGHAAPARRPRWPGTPDQPGLPPLIPTARPEPAGLTELAGRPESTARPEPSAPVPPLGLADQPVPAAPEAMPLTGMPEIAHDGRLPAARPAPGQPGPAPGASVAPSPQAPAGASPPIPAGPPPVAQAAAGPANPAEASPPVPELAPLVPGTRAAQPAAQPAAPGPPAPPVVVVRDSSTARPAAVERALGAPGQLRAGFSWREHVRVVPGGHGPGRPDMERRDRARVLLPIRGSRLIVVLGCTVGAGQSVTALMLADVLASLRTEPVAALDLNPGQASLTELAACRPAASARGLLAGQQPGPPREPGQPDLITHDSLAGGRPDLGDVEYTKLVRILATRYPLTLADPGATAVARVLAAADQLVLVAPASADAARAVAMTMEWLDGHGYSELATNSVAVINGVSKRSISHVEQAELVVRGRCRAVVRVPWDDHLGAPPAGQNGGGAGDSPAISRFGQLRPPTQHAYTALAGVLVSALAVEPARPHGAAT